MKTAMQEMMLNIESIESKTTDQEQIYLLIALKITALILLQKEKEQIIEANIKGFDWIVAEDKKRDYAELYYNEKYKK